jgi:hypothetical protein
MSSENNYIRDEGSKALINTNIKALEEYKAKRDQVKRLKMLEDDMSETKKDVADIKSMLIELLEKNR